MTIKILDRAPAWDCLSLRTRWENPKFQVVGLDIETSTSNPNFGEILSIKKFT